MDITRYIIIPAIIAEKNELIPIWDERIVFNNSEEYGNFITFKDRIKHFNITECIYDLETRKIEIGIEANHYSDINKLKFKVGEQILFEKSHRILEERTIVDIIYENYDLVIQRGKNLSQWERSYIKDVEINPDLLYAIKSWLPTFVLDNDVKVNNEYDMFHKHIIE